MTETILITGGCGGLGYLVAEHLAAKGPVNLILNGRSPLSDKQRTQLAALEQRGCNTFYLQADVSDAEAMQSGVAQAKARLGTVDGLIHAAGVAGRRRLFDQAPGDFQKVLDPKVRGTQVLDEVLAGEPLQFVCYFSSTSAVLGDFGSCDYAVGNRFLMAYARHRNALREQGKRMGRTIVINWPLWREGGMGFGDDQSTAFYLKTSGQRILETREGLALLDRFLSAERGGEAQHLVFAGKPSRIHRFLGICATSETAASAKAPVAVPEGGEKKAVRRQGWSVEKCLIWDLRGTITELLKVPRERLRGTTPLADFGFDSLSLTQFARSLSERYGVEVTPDIFFAHSTLDQLADYFLAEHSGTMARYYSEERHSTNPGHPPIQSGTPTNQIRQIRDTHYAQSGAPLAAPEPIAIIGMSGRFPKARTVDELWNIFVEGINAVDKIPADRFDWQVYGEALGEEAAKFPFQWCGMVPGLAEFDPLFFEISPREAESMDPRQRLLLQEAWNALEDAAYGAQQIERQRIGMFVGVEEGDYHSLVKEGGITSNHTGVLAARLAYFLNLKGPVMALNTACSSGLVAAHQACQSLMNGECDTALAAGVSLLLTPAPLIGMARAGMLSPVGECRAFDKRANGIVPGEAVAVVVLKRLSQAIADGDPIHATLLGSGINHDGRTNGITAPNGVSQTELIREVHRKAGIEAGEIDYIIAHGTGTPLGDPVEINALNDAFKDARVEHKSCALTSAKSNLGHTFAASGLVSLIAMVQSLRHRTIPASLHCEEESDYIPWQRSPFFVNKENRLWPEREGRARTGAVSAFGMSGTNAHLVVREHTAPKTEAKEAAPWHLLVLSAKSEEALLARAEALSAALQSEALQGETLTRIAYTLLEGRHHFRHRCAIVVQDKVAAVRVGQQFGKESLFKGKIPLDFERQEDTQHALTLLIEQLHSQSGESEQYRETLLALADLYCQGYDLCGRDIYREGTLKRLGLPTYPFARERYWAEQGGTGERSARRPELKGLVAPGFPSDLNDCIAWELREHISALLKIPLEKIEAGCDFADVGFDSISLARYAKNLSNHYGFEISPDLFFAYPTVERMTAHLCAEHSEPLKRFYAHTATSPSTISRLPPDEKVSEPALVPRPSEREPIAIIGMSGRFPGARNLTEFWEILAQGKNVVGEIPADRFDWLDCKWCGTIPGVAEFDPHFFEISPLEAANMDPRQRLLLQEAWRALEDAGYGPKQIENHRIGMFVGAEEGDYQRIAKEGSVTSNHVGVLAARLAYFLNLNGPVLALNTACSSSLVAVHTACQNLRLGECDTAIVGGVNLMLTPEPFIAMAQAGMLSHSGKCRSFDKQADGMVPGEAVAVIVLKCLAQALAEGDPIHATILGSGINYDGKTNGLTAPSRAAQADLIREVSRRAAVELGDIDYIVTHGTGTKLGDSAEINALSDAFKQSTRKPGSCALTSAKTNFGHTFAASGLVSLLCMVQALRYRTIPASLHCEEENDFIQWRESPFFVNKASGPWLAEGGKRRRGAVSAFGMSGTNAHVVLEESSTELGRESSTGLGKESSTGLDKESSTEAPYHLLVLSAKTAAALKENANQLRRALEEETLAREGLARITYTLLEGRSHFRHRCAMVVETIEDARQQLNLIGEGKRPTLFQGLVPRGFTEQTVVTRCIKNLLHQSHPLPQAPSAYRDVLLGLAEFYCQGYSISGEMLSGAVRRRLSLPTYAFSRERYWNARDTAAESKVAVEGKMEAKAASDSIGTVLFEPLWKPSPLPPNADEPTFAERIVWICSANEFSTDDNRILLSTGEETLGTRYEEVAIQVFQLLREILNRKPDTKILVQLVVCGENDEFLLTGLTGLLRTAQLENPALACQLIYIDRVPPKQRLERLIAENRCAAMDQQVRYRQGGREVLHWEIVKRDTSGGDRDEVPWRNDGVYLITGGNGELGRLLANEMSTSTSNIRLILCGRSALTEPQKEQFSLGQDYRQADISRWQEVEKLIADIESEYGELNGVIHCAGVIEDGFIVNKTNRQFRDVMAPKVAGTRWLDRATRHMNLDFFLLFSSSAGAQGNPGQADYAAANGFMDAFADYRNQRVAAGECHGHTLSINWPLWQEGGMRVDARRLEIVRQNTGMVPMETSAGMRAIRSAFRAGRAQVMVLAGEVSRLPLLLQRAEAHQQPGADRRPSLNREQIADLLMRVIRELLLIRDQQILDAEATFVELGLDSIHALRFMRELSEKFNVPLRETLVFDYPTIGALAEYLERAGVKPELPADFKTHLANLCRRYEEIVPLQIEGDGPLLYCIHPMSGDVGIYTRLAELAGSRFRVVGIKSRGFLTEREPLTTVEEMGGYYARMLSEIQPRQPKHIIGTSMGGMVAFEAVRQLQLNRDSVQTLLLVEAPLIDSDEDAALWESDQVENYLMNANFLLISLLHLEPDFREKKARGEINWSDLVIDRDELNLSSVEARGGTDAWLVDRLVNLIKSRAVTPAESYLKQRLQSMATIHLANLRALQCYRASPLPQPQELGAFLLRSRTGDAVADEVYNPDYLVRVQRAKGGLLPFFEAWQPVLPGITTIEVEGSNHFDLLSGEGSVKQMVERIAAILTAPVVTGFGAKAARPAIMQRDALPDKASEKIAIIGMSGRFPGAETLDQFYALLKSGQSALAPLPTTRGWDLREIPVSRGGFLPDIDKFDPLFFNIPPHEAALMDPAERLFLQESWRAIEDAGVDPNALSGKNWGVFCGGGGDYTLRVKEHRGISPHVTSSGIPGRVSYTLNLAGPSLSVDVGCASSLLALAQACDHLVLGKCEVAVAGGVLIHSTPNLIQLAWRSEMLSRGGQCLALDRRANGMLVGEGVCAVVLKPLQKALADGDRIHGVIEAWGNNHNGKTNGMAAPSVKAQAALVVEVYRRFGIDPETIGLVEANATGTLLGDTVEIQALGEAFGQYTGDRHYCALGTVENHIGHAYQCSGMAHLMKVVLALKQKEIPGTLHVEQPSAALELNRSPFFINRHAVHWPTRNGEPRRAAINSFGATGTNVHMVLAEAPANLPLTAPLSLPGYPFEKRRCWLEDENQGSVSHQGNSSSDVQGCTSVAGGRMPGVTDVQGCTSVAGGRMPGVTDVQGATSLAIIQQQVQAITGYRAEEMDPALPLSRYGLDSLMSMRLLALVNERFGLELQLADLAVNDSLAALARLVDNEPSAGEPKQWVETPKLAITANESTAESRWFFERIDSLPEALHVVRVARGDFEREAPLETLDWLTHCHLSLSRLLQRGIGIFNAGSHCYFVAHRSIDLATEIERLDVGAQAGLLRHCPAGLLVAPVSQEQERNLYHSEVMKKSAWNIHHVYQSTIENLDEFVLKEVIASLTCRHDLLRTRYAQVGTSGWAQLIEHKAPPAFQIIEMPSLEAFQRFILEQKNRLLPLAELPLFHLWLTKLEGNWHFGFVTHHSLADAFTTTLLFTDMMRFYAALADNGNLPNEPAGEQYWQYTLGQFDRHRYSSRKTAQFWRERLAGTTVAMKLPYSSAPESLDEEHLQHAESRVITLSDKLNTAIDHFHQVHGITFTHLFSSAIALALVQGMGNEKALIQYVNNQRDRASLLNTPGEFTNILFVPFEISAFPKSGSLTVLQFLLDIKQQSLACLRHAKTVFSDLLALIGLDNYKGYYRQRSDVVIDSADIDTATLGQLQAYGSSRYTECFEGGEQAGEGQALATVFFQLLRVNRRIHFITSYRNALFDSNEMQHFAAMIVDIVDYMVQAPEQSFGQLLTHMQKPLQKLREWSMRFASVPPARPRGKPRFFAECQRLNHVKQGRPVFWFHGGLGGVEAYRVIADEVQRPFYGIQARGWMTDSEPLQGVEAMATYYVHIIKSVQPEGPYDLGGYSLGGVLAYEVTRQLQEQGDEVESIVMLDSYDVIDTRPSEHFNKKAMLGAVNLALQNPVHRDQLDCGADDDAFWSELITLARERGLTKTEGQLQELIQQMTKFGRALEGDQYSIPPLSAPESVKCYYFRNKSGKFYGKLEPYFTLPGTTSLYVDNMNYWRTWEERLPNLEITDVDASNHTSLLTEKGSAEVIISFCWTLYSTVGCNKPAHCTICKTVAYSSHAQFSERQA